MRAYFTFTRDSSIWWLAMAAALFAYLSTKPEPTVWNYQDWVQFFSATVAAIAGKLMHSGLPSSTEVRARDAVVAEQAVVEKQEEAANAAIVAEQRKEDADAADDH
jgi:hypothetical protein